MASSDRPSGMKSPEHEHYHIYAVEKRDGNLAEGHVLRQDKPAATYRTTSTAAIAVEEDDEPSNTQPSSHADSEYGGNDDYDIHAVLLSVQDMLHPADRCTLNVALDRDFYMVLLSHDPTSQACLLGIERARGTAKAYKIDIVLRVDHDIAVNLDGDGGFLFSPGFGKRLVPFKPASVRSLWSAVQCIYKIKEGADSRESADWTWLDHYRNQIDNPDEEFLRWSIQAPERKSELEIIREQQLNEPAATSPEKMDRKLEQAIIAKLKEMMFASDLDQITSKELRKGLEAHFEMDLKKFRKVIDQQMITIMGQMEPSSKIFDYMYLGTEWNASNWEELERNNCTYILNVTNEIPNTFPDKIKYYNVKVWDVPEADIWTFWDDTFRFIREARLSGASILVHCKMGVSRSASTVIAYAMKQYKWSLEEAHAFVKKRRKIIKPNEGFRQQLVLYEGFLRASRTGSFGQKVGKRAARIVNRPSRHNRHGIRRVTPPDSPVSTPPNSPPPTARSTWNLTIGDHDSSDEYDEHRGSSDADNTSIPDPEIMSTLTGAVANRIRHYSTSKPDDQRSEDSTDEVASPRASPLARRRGLNNRPRPHSLHLDRQGWPTGQSRAEANRIEPALGSTMSDDERALLPQNHLADRLTKLAVSADELTTATRHKLTGCTTSMTSATHVVKRPTPEPASPPSNASAAGMPPVTPAVSSASLDPASLQPPSSLSRSKSLPSKGMLALASANKPNGNPPTGPRSLTGATLPMPPRGFRKGHGPAHAAAAPSDDTPAQQQQAESASQLIANDGQASSEQPQVTPSAVEGQTAADEAEQATDGSSEEAIVQRNEPEPPDGRMSKLEQTPQQVPVADWPSNMVEAWLPTVGLEHLVPLFVKEQISGQDLLDLNNDDLKSIGITTLHERKTVLRACRKLMPKEEEQSDVSLNETFA
eukprot:TRINITY_DN8409_c0_g1_i2.p1 TRINITY_DN8409_c0_g1~~TRINITY_DN8409_c0_g1_i2.p1  ORF type:complete len:953 (+),score=184.87 TRINITY_DN8409_c0_g1_i2:66-2861(+)